MENLYKITGRKGINDLKSLYAFVGNSQGDSSASNSIEEYQAAKGWMSFVFDCELTQEAIEEEIQKRKSWNETYIKELKETGEYGKVYFINVQVELDPIYDAPTKSTPVAESFRMEFLDLSKHK